MSVRGPFQATPFCDSNSVTLSQSVLKEDIQHTLKTLSGAVVQLPALWVSGPRSTASLLLSVAERIYHMGSILRVGNYDHQIRKTGTEIRDQT